METLKDMTRQLQQTPNGEHEGLVYKFLKLLNAGGDYRETIPFDGVNVPLIFYFAYHVNWHEGEVSSQIVKALLPKYTVGELQRILRGKVDLVEQTMYTPLKKTRELFTKYKGVVELVDGVEVGLTDGLVEPDNEYYEDD